MSRPPSLCCHSREIERQENRWWGIGEPAPLHHVSDAAKVQAGIIARDPRIRISEASGQFDDRRHLRRHGAIMHRYLLSGDCDRAALDLEVNMNHNSSTSHGTGRFAVNSK